jgi:glyoxylase-like metal-dependent hydrolase (beta-lactamase superfamily II)
MLQHLAGRVWLYPSDPDPGAVQGGVAVIAGDEDSTIVDAGHSPGLARLVQSAMAGAGLPPARRLIYTHHHWDHTWGACAWPEVEIIGHEAGVAPLEADAARPWSHAYLREQVAANPLLGPSFRARALAVDFTELEILPPTLTFASSLSVDGVEVRHVGGHHAPDSTVVAVPDSSVLLLGDCYYPPPWHLRTPEDGMDVAQLRELVGLEFEWYVTSHQPPWRGGEAPDLP